MSDAPAPEVQHESANHRFVYRQGDTLAELGYEIAPGRMTFSHTWVPEQFRGQGIAEKLVRAGLAEARQQQLAVIPQCSYVAKFIDRHSEFQDLLAK